LGILNAVAFSVRLYQNYWTNKEMMSTSNEFETTVGYPE